ncbi:hypothetical protein D3C75_924930 [compost metagenome]
MELPRSGSKTPPRQAVGLYRGHGDTQEHKVVDAGRKDPTEHPVKGQTIDDGQPHEEAILIGVIGEADRWDLVTAHVSRLHQGRHHGALVSLTCDITEADPTALDALLGLGRTVLRSDVELRDNLSPSQRKTFPDG